MHVFCLFSNQFHNKLVSEPWVEVLRKHSWWVLGGLDTRIWISRMGILKLDIKKLIWWHWWLDMEEEEDSSYAWYSNMYSLRSMKLLNLKQQWRLQKIRNTWYYIYMYYTKLSSYVLWQVKDETIAYGL